MLRRLRYFQSVVRLNSFSQAAEENYISQSAISQQIQALEKELGFPLLERKNRGFTLTAAGAYFYQKSLSFTAEYEKMCAEAAQIAQGDPAGLTIGYLRCYSGSEFHRALAEFAARRPEVNLSVEYGRVDLVLNDQRRAFSQEYVNLILTTCRSLVEVSARSPLAQLERISPEQLKDVPCILIASPAQRETEQAYYQTIIGIQSELLYAENMEEARLMVIGRKGFLPVEGASAEPVLGVVRLPLVRSGQPILRNYCAFWRRENAGRYVETFAALLQAEFQEFPAETI